MIGLSLSLRRSTGPIQPAAAWFIAGDNPHIWLAEMSRWDVPLTGARLYALPSSGSDRQPSGLLVRLAEGKTPVADSIMRAEAYQLIGTKLYIPANAQLNPDLTAQELNTALTFDVNLLHPATGLIGFKSTDGKSAASLIARPSRRRAEWTGAQPGAAPYGRLVHIEPEAVLSLEALLKAARGDIGSQPLNDPTDGQNPREEPEPSGILDRLAAGMVKLFAPLLGGVGTAGEGGAPPPSKRNSIADARNKEIERLLDMFKNDPEAGLRHAIPFGGGGSRGIGRSGDKLIPHGADFNLKNIRGGRAADYWSIPPDIQRQLRQQYLNAANRELSLGHFRRAAYIFAELLGDNASAANALKQGKHFREAAVVYRDVLKNRVMAAECLESGGQLLDAVALREELEQWMECARLYEKLERPDDVKKSYARAANAELKNKNFTAAAKIYSDKMEEHNLALAVLASGWSNSPQAQECLSEQFALLGRLGRHAGGVKLIQELRTETLTNEQSRLAAKVLTQVSTNYPDVALRGKAADATRTIAGARLSRVPIELARQLAHSVSSLAPEDRLLARDTLRFIEQRRIKERAAATKPLSTKKLLLKRTFALPGSTCRAAASANGEFFYAFQFGPFGSMTILRGTWDAHIEEQRWPPDTVRQNAPVHLEAPRLPSQPILAKLFGPRRSHMIGMKALPVSEHFPHPTSVGTPDWLPPDLAGFCYNDSGSVYTVTSLNGYSTLSLFGSNGQLLEQQPIEQLDPAREARWLPIVSRSDSVFISNGLTRLHIYVRGKHEVVDVASPIHALAAAVPYSKLRVAVSLEEGGLLLWPTPQSQPAQIPFGQGMVRPAAAFTRAGALVAVTQSEIRIYSTENETLSLLSSSPITAQYPIIAVVPAAGLNDFAVFQENGEVRLYQAPG